MIPSSAVYDGTLEFARDYFFPDVNECLSGLGLCEQLCTNTVGSYTCSCIPAYSLTSNLLSCLGKSRVDADSQAALIGITKNIIINYRYSLFVYSFPFKKLLMSQTKVVRNLHGYGYCRPICLYTYGRTRQPLGGLDSQPYTDHATNQGGWMTLSETACRIMLTVECGLLHS